MFKKLLLLKNKLLIICTLPLLVISAVLSWGTLHELTAFKNEQISHERNNLLTQKKNEMKSLVLLALSSMADILAKPASQERDDAVIKMLNQLNYGDETYFFINSYDMISIANGRKGFYEPRPLNFTRSSPNEKHPLELMVDKAKEGGGFIHYTAYKKHTRERQFDKMAYTQNIPGSNWLIGTGYFIDDIEEAVARKVDNFDMTLTRIITTTGIATIVVLMLSLVLCFVSIMKALRPFNNMNEALYNIAHGEGDLTHKLSVETDDEVGRCAKSFNDFSEKIRQIVLTVTKEAQGINDATMLLDKASQSSQNLVHEQRVKTEYLSQVIYEMVTTAQEITNNGNHAAEAANEASEEAIKTSESLMLAVNKLQELNDDINKSSDAMNKLELETDAIGSVLEVIQQIAEQTNLLALNAAIEAARAGEQGRGFAVVADEVRTLASRTQSSTEEIRAMINRLQAGAQNAVSAMAVSQASSLQAKEVAVASNESLEKVNKAIAVINEVNSVVATAAKEQTDVTEDLNNNLHGLCELTTNTEQEMKLVAQTSEELKSNVMALNKEMSSFTV
ncbi:MAG: methyl-accepting chemotaxis protein [Thalassotalea sp.]